MENLPSMPSERDWPGATWAPPYPQEYREDGSFWISCHEYHQRSDFTYRNQFYGPSDGFRQPRRALTSASNESDELYDSQGIVPTYPEAVLSPHEPFARSVSPDETESSEASNYGYYSHHLSPKLYEPTSPEMPMMSGISGADFSYMCSPGNPSPSASDHMGMLPYSQATSTFVSPVEVGGPLIITANVDHYADIDDFEQHGVTFQHEGSYSGIKVFNGDQLVAANADLAPPYQEDVTNLPTPPSSSPEDIGEDDADGDWSPKGTRSAKRNAQAARNGGSQALRPTRTAARVSKSISPKTNGSQSTRGSKSSAAVAAAAAAHTANAIDERRDSGSNGEDKVKPFTCPLRPYGCQSRCASKNEWKRHITSQHFCLGYYRCDLCADSETRPNDFNRKDLFTQHLRRMHHSTARWPFHRGVGTLEPEKKRKDATATGSKKGAASKASGKTAGSSRKNGDEENNDSALEHAIPEIQKRCFKLQRQPPTAFRCAFCTHMFEGDGCYDAWLEHVAKHMASTPTGEPAAKRHRRNDSTADGRAADGTLGGGDSETVDWMRDEHLRNWLVQEQLLQQQGPSSFTLMDKNISKGLVA